VTTGELSMNAATNSARLRQRDLARIHLAKKHLGLDDETYRELLLGLTGKSSAGEMNRRERWTVLQEVTRLGARASKVKGDPGKPQAPAPEKARLLAKIEAQLSEAGYPWAYANAMACRMFGVDLVQWCYPDQLRRIVAALVYDARRKEPR
jgi:phage gp16-like protein